MAGAESPVALTPKAVEMVKDAMQREGLAGYVLFGTDEIQYFTGFWFLSTERPVIYAESDTAPRLEYFAQRQQTVISQAIAAEGVAETTEAQNAAPPTAEATGDAASAAIDRPTKGPRSEGRLPKGAGKA